MAESMQGLHRTCRCAEVTKEMIGKEVVLMGWVQKARDKGGIIFVDLRDRSGIMQLIFENGSIDEEGFAKAGKLRSEFVIAVTGVVEERGGAVNKNLATGEIEKEGVRIPIKAKKASQKRADAAFERLLAAAKRLLDIVYKNEGLANKEKAKFESQIQNLADKWDRLE